MNISELCIRRPVMTGLLSIAAIVAGLLAYTKLPVAAVPRVDFPVITIFANFPGASPETMATSVALPLERELSTIAGVDTMSSINGQDTSQITVQFQLNKNIDAAAQDVQAALTRAQRRLPVDMLVPPSYRKVNPADAPVVLLTLSGSDKPLYYLNDIVSTIISPALSRVIGRGAGPGVRRAALRRAGAARPRPHRRHGPGLRHHAAGDRRRPIPRPRSAC